jgi:uncharacterized protein (UPF0332 family)
MILDDLLQEKKIQAYDAKPLEIQQLLSVAIRDLETASRNLPEDPDWAYNIAYNAVLQSARALMMSTGYRPRGSDHHATVVRFTEGVFGKNPSMSIALFDQMRRKRNRAVYEVSGVVSKKEAEESLVFARQFVEEVRKRISKQLKLPL